MLRGGRGKRRAFSGSRGYGERVSQQGRWPNLGSPGLYPDHRGTRRGPGPLRPSCKNPGLLARKPLVWDGAEEPFSLSLAGARVGVAFARVRGRQSSGVRYGALGGVSRI